MKGKGKFMMRTFHLALISLSLTACATSSPYRLESMTYSAADLKPSPQRGLASTGTSSSEKAYLSIDLPYTAFEKIRKDLESSLGKSLQHRGEAHITVITPPEMKILRKKISGKEIQALAERMDLQKSAYQLLCVGKGQSKEDATYYAVIESDRLFQIRKAVHLLYTSKGGKAGDFNPDQFYPHVTLGFTKKDLHLEDGIIKDASSCIYSLRAQDSAAKN